MYNCCKHRPKAITVDESIGNEKAMQLIRVEQERGMGKCRQKCRVICTRYKWGWLN